MPHYIEPARCGNNLKFVRRHSHHGHHHHHRHHHGHHHHGHHHDKEVAVEVPAYNRCRPDCAGLTTQQWAAACARDAAWAAAYEGTAREASALRGAAAAREAELVACAGEAARQREANQAVLGENARLGEVAAAAEGRADGFRRRVRDQARELDALRAAHTVELKRRDVEHLDHLARQADLLRDKRRADEAAAAARADAARLRQRLEACRHCRELRHLW